MIESLRSPGDISIVRCKCGTTFTNVTFKTLCTFTYRTWKRAWCEPARCDLNYSGGCSFETPLEMYTWGEFVVDNEIWE